MILVGKLSASSLPTFPLFTQAKSLAQVVQHERDQLDWIQGVEDYEQRETDRVGQQRFLLRVDPILPAHDRAGYMDAQGLLASRLAQTQHVKAHPRDHRRQPSTQVKDTARVRAAEAEPESPPFSASIPAPGEPGAGVDWESPAPLS